MSPSTSPRTDPGPGEHPLTLSERAIIRRRLATASGAFLATDFDGTVAPISDDPDAATIRPDARGPLESLAGNPRVDVAVVSGRALADVRERIDVDATACAGNHGLEIELSAGPAVGSSAGASPVTRRVHPVAEQARSQLRGVADRLRERLSDVEGAFLEDKGLTVTVHHRRVDDGATVDRVRSLARTVASEYDALTAREGRAIVELRPTVDWDKGRALEWLWETVPGADRRHPIYLGDDDTDEDAFEALTHGTTIAVGRDPAETAAEFVVEGPADVAAILAWIDRLLATGRKHVTPPAIGGR